MKKIILIFTILFTTFINSQSLVGKKYVAYLGNKCGGEFSSFFYTELNFEKDKVLVSNYIKQDIGDRNLKQFIETKEYCYKVKNKFLTIVGSKYEKIEILNNKLKNNQLIFDLIITNKNLKIIYILESGGKDASFCKLAITKDSIKCENGSLYPFNRDDYNEKTEVDLWEKLNDKFDLIEFTKLNGQKSVKYIDYMDEEIIVEVDGKKYSILNLIESKEVNKSIFDFISLLRNQSKKFAEKSMEKEKK
jgi:hypothetical protein